MARSVVEFFDEASELDEHDRATLAGLLTESIEHEPDPDVEDAWKREIARRIEELDFWLCFLGPLGRGEGEVVPCSERRILIVRFHAAAEAELLEARAWYAKRAQLQQKRLRWKSLGSYAKSATHWKVAFWAAPVGSGIRRSSL